MKSSDKYSKIIFKRMGIRILIFSVIFSLILAFGFAVGEYISGQIIWQPTDRLYIFLVNIRNLLPFIWAVGITGIIFFYLRKSLIYIDYIMEASNKLIANDEKYIELPADLKMLENRLNQSKKTALDNAAIAKANEERKNELIVYLAHDLKTPLTSIIGYLEILNESPDLPIEARAKYSKITLEKAYRLEELINEFFEIARFNIGKIVLNKTKLNNYTEIYSIFYELLSVIILYNEEYINDYESSVLLDYIKDVNTYNIEYFLLAMDYVCNNKNVDINPIRTLTNRLSDLSMYYYSYIIAKELFKQYLNDKEKAFYNLNYLIKNITPNNEKKVLKYCDIDLYNFNDKNIMKKSKC